MSAPDPVGRNDPVLCCFASRLLCWRSAPMGAGLSQTQDGGAPAAAVAVRGASQPATMAEVVRERKKKMNGGLATLRRRLLAGGRRGDRAGRSSRHGDRAAPLRDLLKEWSPSEVGALLEEYEALAALRDLCVQAELARPPAAALHGDLALLYDQKICPDAELTFKGASFPVHRAILSARCPYFRDLLGGCSGSGSKVRLEAPLPSQIDIATVDALLRYLYAGEPAPPSSCTSCEGEVCDPRRPGSIPDCCPSQAEPGRSHEVDGDKLNLDVVGRGNLCRRRTDPILLRRIAADLGATPSALRRDLRHLLEATEFTDASLVFTSEPPPSAPTAGNSQHSENVSTAGSETNFSKTTPVTRAGSPPSSSEYGFRPRLELPCHRAILSARSPFFRSVIQRRCRLLGNSSEAFGSVKIVLDERVIPHKYARVLLHTVYTDQVDLNLIMRGGSSIFGCSILSSHSTSLGEAQALTNNQQLGNMSSLQSLTPLEEAMELYEIGRFLELDILSQGCEDIIAERLSANSLAAVLKWSAQPHGSKWVHRQALRYLREEFLTVASGPALPQLEAIHLAHALRCPFLQASELDALKATLRWGEYRLIKRMEDREPNLLSHTAHSVTRKGVKKRDLSDTELRELLADLLPLVRIDHILPSNNELLNQAIRRGLLSSPPSYMLGDEGSAGSRADAWIRGKGGLYVRPRLYMPYYEEVKALLEDQMVQEAELVRMRRARYIPDIPDTLYMVSAEPRARSSASGAPAESPQGAGANDIDSNSRSCEGNIGGNVNNGDGCATVPPAPATMRAMLARERELRRAPASIRATSLPLSHTAEINRQIRLRVVREFNLPDSVADTLEGAALALEGSCNGGRISPPCVNMGSGRIRDCCMGDSNQHQVSTDGMRSHSENDSSLDDEENNGQFSHPNDAWCNDSPRVSRRPLPALLTEGDPNRSQSADSSRQQKNQVSQSGRGLSEVMPDVAMATSSLGRLRISTFNQPPAFNMPRRNRNSNNLENVDVEAIHNSGFSSMNRDPNNHCEAGHTSRDGSAAHTPVTFMNPNQHLLQEGCSLGAFNFKGRESRKAQKQASCSQRVSDCSALSSEDSRYQNNETENTTLQLDLGDGNQHSSPAKQSAPSTWKNHTSTNRQNERMRVSTVTSDYSQTQPQMSNSSSNRTNYSRYLASQSIPPSGHGGQAMKWSSKQMQNHPEELNKPHGSAHASTLNSPIPPTSISSFIPTSPFRIIGGPLTALTSNNYVQPNNGFSTLQHHSRSRSPRHLHTNVTLQRPRPLCPGIATPVCNSSSNLCPAMSNSAVHPCSVLSVACSAAETVPDKDIHRSQSAGSVSSLGLDREKRENKSGYNHQSPFVGSALEPPNQITSPHNPPNSFGSLHHKESSPRHFRSISSFPDQGSVYGENSNCRNTNYQIGANLIETSINRNQYEQLSNWIQPGNQCVSNDERNQYFLRTSKDNFYCLNQGFALQRDGNYHTISSNGQYKNDNLFSVGLENYNCLPQSNRPSSCGLVDVINTYNSSRGESPLYGGMNSSSRGNSPFRTLDGTPNQLSRQNSPYSSNHRMDFSSRIQNDNYCQPSMQRSSSPSPRMSYQARNISGSPSGLKIQSQHGSRTLSSSPSSSFNNQQSLGVSKTRTVSESPTGSYPLLKQTPRSMSNSPSMNINQSASNMKIHQNLKSMMNSPSTSSPMTMNHGSLKNQQRSSPNTACNSSKIDPYSNLGLCQQNMRDEAKSQTLRLSSSQYHIGSNAPPKFL